MRRRLAARQRERGAVLVETVVVLPLVLLLVFGIVEWSAAYHDSSVTADAARAGGRIASAQARNPDYATNAAASVAAALSTLPSNAPQELWIYKANTQRLPGHQHRLQQLRHELHQVRVELVARSSSTPPHPQGGGWPASTPAGVHASRSTRSASTSRSTTTS